MRSMHSVIQGVPTPLRKATRWAVVGAASAALIGQLIGVKLISPASAQGIGDCLSTCIAASPEVGGCAGLRGLARAICVETCAEVCGADSP